MAAACSQQAVALYLLGQCGADPEVGLHDLPDVTSSQHLMEGWCFFQPMCLALMGCHAAQAEDKEGETPLSAAAAHGKLRDLMVAVAKGEVDVNDLLSVH